MCQIGQDDDLSRTLVCNYLGRFVFRRPCSPLVIRTRTAHSFLRLKDQNIVNLVLRSLLAIPSWNIPVSS